MAILSVPTPNFFGFGEFWSGLAIGVLLIPAGFILYTFIEDWWLMRGDGSPPDLDELSPDRPAGAGVLVCDYVDAEMLRTIAQQKDIAPEPKESERGRSVTREGSVGLQKIPIAGRLSRKSNEDEKLRFEHREDHNVLLSSVMDALENDGELQRGLERKPDVSLGSSHVLDELAAMTERHSEAETAREALATINSRLMADQKRSEFEAAAEANAFVLVEGSWSVANDGDSTVLRLRKLTPVWKMYGPDDTDPVDVPPGVSLEARVRHQDLSPQGRDRLDGEEQTAAIFGIAARETGGTLVVSPVAIFGRYGVTRSDGFIARGGYPGAC